MNQIRVAIDGPAGAGKSTVAKTVAKRLGLLYVDTGAMYRAVTWKTIQSGISFDDIEKIVHLAASLHISFKIFQDMQLVFVNEMDVTEQIRSPQVTENVSRIASIHGVREEMVKLQRAMAIQQGVVMDGRDIGTIVLPTAEVKVFLTASLDERAKRRMEELKNKGIQVTFEELKNSIQARDEMDSTRKVSPLQKAEDAVEVDTSKMSIQEVVDFIVSICKNIKHELNG